MRPIKLTLQAFGSYIQETTIDFDKLGANGLFLITGNTGSGKTMIFDGIVYALYGVSSGGQRDKNEFRAKAAPDNMPTVVELIFAYQGSEYAIKRTFGKLKRDGTLNMNVDVEFRRLPDGLPITKADQVNGKIRDLLGITADQFRQIAMLAQGKFRELIDKNTRDRNIVFKSIFHIERYEKLQEALKKRCSAAKDKYNLKKGELDGLIGRIGMPKDISAKSPELAPQTVKVGMAADSADLKSKLTFEQALELVRKLLEIDCRDKADCEARSEELGKQLAGVNENIGSATAYEAAKRQLLECEQNAPLLAQESERCRLRFQEAELRVPEGDKAREAAAALQEQTKQYVRLSELQSDCEQTKKYVTVLEQECKMAEAAVQEAQEYFEKLQLERDSLSDCATKAASLQGELESCTKQSESVSDALKQQEDLETAYTRLNEAQETYLRIAAEATNIANEFELKQNAYLGAQAGILAERLQEGVPCPVCGSLEHPHPTPRPLQVPSQQELEQLEAKRDKAAKNRDDASCLAAQCKGSFDSLCRSFVTVLQQLLPDVVLEEGDVTFLKQRCLLEAKQQSLHANCQQLNQALAVAAKHAKRCQDLEKELIPRQEKAKQAKDQKWQNLRNELAASTSKLETMQANCEQARQGLAFPSRDEANKAIETYRQQAEEIRYALDLANKQMQRAQELQNINASDVSRLKEQLQNKPEHSVEELRLESQRLTEEQKKLSEQRDEFNSRIRNNENVRDSLFEGIDEIEQLRCHSQLLDDLNSVASGQYSKQSLENYVLGYYLDLIIDRANKRYCTMTDGRYRIVRSANEKKGNRQVGLDLNVFDSYDGQVRPISTLSGGESFLAALALALGFSDEVQASSGGIQLDAMFVDEGFGSLDRDALSIAINALRNLQDGNRLVGIISHVEDLEGMIDKKIRVTHTQEKGSAVAIDVR